MDGRMSNEIFDLIYIRKSDSRIFHARRIILGHYSLRDPITSEKIKATRHELTRDYEYQDKLSKENVRRRTCPMLAQRMAV